MAIVQSFGQAQALTAPTAPMWVGGSSGSIALFNACPATYAGLYRTQPAVRRMVDFLSRNVAQLPLPVYRRITDTDRERLPRHELATLLADPNPGTTGYRLIESLMGDLGVYFAAFWLKIRAEPMGLLRLPPDEMQVEGGLIPTGFVWTRSDGRQTRFAPSEIVYFNGYNPSSSILSVSPLETLRGILAEEHAAGDYRAGFWRNAGRMEGVIEQTKDAPNWNPTQQDAFRAQWQEFSAGGAKVGMTAVLPKGMTLKPWSFSSRDSEFTATRKLNTEEVAAAYHIPQPMVGLLDRATFSNVTELHQMLYTDCLGPWLTMIVQEIKRQVLPECRVTTNIYLEFNIDVKLRGSFEQQTAALFTSIGRPWRTVNEGRGLQNLRSTADPNDDKVGAPLNMSYGPPADAASAPPVPAETAAAADAPVRQFWARQGARIAKLPADERAQLFDAERWDAELAEDLGEAGVPPALAGPWAAAINADTLALLTADVPAFAATRAVPAPPGGLV